MIPTLYTIGYEAHPHPRSLVQALRAARVELVVDVRELPMSRRFGFSKTRLAETLTRAGLEYEHHRELGNPKPFRDLYRNGRQDEGEARYRAFLSNGSEAAVDQLAELLDTRRVCVLCFEADPATCHRAVIVDELSRRLPRLRVEHL